MRFLSSFYLARLGGLVALIVWILGTVALAQTPSPATPEIEAPAAAKIGVQATGHVVPLEEVPDRAQATRAKLDAFLPREASRQTLARSGSGLDRTISDINTLLAKTRAALAAGLGVRTLQKHEAELSEMRERIQPWSEELDRQLTVLRVARQQLDTTAALWAATAAAARQEGAAGTTVTRIANLRGDIDKVRSTIVERRNQTLEARDRLVDPSYALSVNLEQMQSAIDSRLQGIFRAGQPPLWSPQVRESLREEWKAGGPKHILQQLRQGGEYAREQGGMLGFHLTLFVTLALVMRALRTHARAWAEDDYNLRDAKEVFECPEAMALLIAVLLTAPLHLLAPRSADFVASALIAVAALWIGRRFLITTMAPLVWGIVVLFVVDRGRGLLDATLTLERVFFLVEMAAALGFVLWLLRPSRLARIPPELRRAPYHRSIDAVTRVAAAALAFAIVAELAGWADLASLLGDAALRSGFLGLFVFVLLKVVQSLATFALVLWPLRLLRAISYHRLLVRRRIEQVLNLLAVILWAMLVLAQVGLLGPVGASVGRVFDAGVSVGAFSVSLGDVMAFALTVWLSFLLARLVNFVLQEDVFTRVRTARGVPYAISGLLRYTLIFLGFLVGLSAAGFELTKLAIIAGGLGVGIGFGLQTVVNNFVSGLILLFERPIQIGDSVEVSDTWGEMKRIGIRASVVRTFDGAEVIVPNAMLVSEKVTNWTLSDKRSRIELNVGVEYGTPAQRVIDLLLEVAKTNPNVARDPEPGAYFVNFGDSALEFKLRVWIRDFEVRYASRSELAVAIQAALEQAGIGVPFPQRDVHIIETSGPATTAKATPEKSARSTSGKILPIRSDRHADDFDHGQDNDD